MKNLYNISKGQLVTLWVFGIAAIVWAMRHSCNWYASCLPDLRRLSGGGNTTAVDLLIFVLAFILVFYTIGWRNRQNKF
jgi:hypothetical protein